MAIEHSCHSCGLPLGAIAALRDPEIGLCVVVCPECSTASVRRRHPLVGTWRSFCTVFWGAYAMLWRIVAGLVLALGSMGVSSIVQDSLAGLRPSELVGHYLGEPDLEQDVARWRANSGLQLLVLYVGWFVGMGVAASGGLAHVRQRVWVWLAVFGLPWVLVALTAVIHVLDRWSQGFPIHAPLMDAGFVANTRFYVGVQAVGLPLALLGVPLGRVLRRASFRRDQRRWIKKLARARKRRRDR